MAITVLKKNQAWRVFEGDGLKMKFVTIDLGTYATNGVAIAASDCGMDHIFALFIEEPFTTNIKAVRFDRANMKIVGYSDQDATEITNSTDLAGQLLNAIVVGV